MKDRIKDFTGEFDFLSNKFTSTFYYKGTKYKSVAHAYQSLKAKHDGDATKIRNAKTATEAIKEGRGVEVKSDWQETCKDLMEELLYLKFSTNVFLKPKLLATGVCQLGDGRNFVGELLMKVRERIKGEKSEDE